MSTELHHETPIPEDNHTENSTAPSSAATFTGNDTSKQAQEIWDKVVGILGNFPEMVSDFFKEYKRPILVIGILLAAVISVKLLLAILGAVNEIPLLAPTFELIGLTYSGWFIYRYLLRASNRRELLDDLNTLKAQVLGKSA